MMNPLTMDRYAVQSALYNIASSLLKNSAVGYDMDTKITQFIKGYVANVHSNMRKSQLHVKSIKKADKGPHAVILAKSDYELEARRQLYNSAIYQQVIEESINVASLLRDHSDSAVSQRMLSLPDADKKRWIITQSESPCSNEWIALPSEIFCVPICDPWIFSLLDNN
ncbi:hypothetical protein GJ496_008432 [Pomphorhynchus laevis]|nr:hypothetical protein GJ496_008432 [Pomphorhynchus laevis]